MSKARGKPLEHGGVRGQVITNPVRTPCHHIEEVVEDHLVLLSRLCARIVRNLVIHTEDPEVAGGGHTEKAACKIP